MKLLHSLVVISVLLAGCGQSMETQHKAHSNGTTDAWSSRQTARRPPPGTVAIGDAAWRAESAQPPKVTAALLARGRNDYDTFCSECHGFNGNGHGAVVKRGFPYPGTLNDDRSRALPARAIFDDITHGTGIMFSYRAQVRPRGRWAIVAYIRALQLSQDAHLPSLPKHRRGR